MNILTGYKAKLSRQNKMRGKPLSVFLNRGPASKSPQTGAGLAQTIGLQDLPTFYPRIFLLMIKDRQKGERTNRK